MEFELIRVKERRVYREILPNVFLRILMFGRSGLQRISKLPLINRAVQEERGDVPGWVLVVLMTTGLVTAIWTIAAPRLSAILRNSLDSMNAIR